jgi:hypothetical protein
MDESTCAALLADAEDIAASIPAGRLVITLPMGQSLVDTAVG